MTVVCQDSRTKEFWIWRLRRRWRCAVFVGFAFEGSAEIEIFTLKVEFSLMGEFLLDHYWIALVFRT